MANGVGVIVADRRVESSVVTLSLPLDASFAPTPCSTQTRDVSVTRRREPVYIPLPPAVAPLPPRLTPPLAPPAARWLSEEAHRQLLGIPISPGDVITANSDVVVGRPAGLGPRAPPPPARRPSGPAHILEIRKMPQIYHTDLPPTPLLVQLQPSQVANVMIPRGSSAALVVAAEPLTVDAEVGRASERHEVLRPPERLMPPPPRRPPTRKSPQLLDTQTEHNSLFAIRHRPVNVALAPPVRMPPKRFAAPEGRPPRRTTIQTIFFEARSTTPRPRRKTTPRTTRTTNRTSPRTTPLRLNHFVSATKNQQSPKVISFTTQRSHTPGMTTSRSTPRITARSTFWTTTVRVTSPRTTTLSSTTDAPPPAAMTPETTTTTTTTTTESTTEATTTTTAPPPTRRLKLSSVWPKMDEIATRKGPKLRPVILRTSRRPDITFSSTWPTTLVRLTKPTRASTSPKLTTSAETTTATTTTTTTTTSTSEAPMSIELIVGTASHARPSVHIVEAPPVRDEQEPPEVSRVLLGGVLIASPPPTTDTPSPDSLCWPTCRAHRNEVCQRTVGAAFAKCVCRAGFARMFPDRPCRPTYTYAMAVRLGRLGGSRLFWDAALGVNNSARFHHMQAVAHEALHRTAMQSDLRDIYHGLTVSGFEKTDAVGAILAHFQLQLSDTSDEERLRGVFGKYLRASNLSLGGTDLFAVDSAVSAADFDECRHASLHDCSANAICFNLRGTYTCSCREGFADVSENALYPGRRCSAAPLGCATCSFHGVCVTETRCECFAWYGGATCRINLKALLIALVTLAGVLVCVLVGCVLATGRRITRRSCGALMVPVVAMRSSKAPDRAAIVDNASDTSEEPVDDKERSLTVMIPRAKYQSRQSVSSACDAKLLSYLDASATISAAATAKEPAPPGALVSAGFEVSATVGDDWLRTVSEARSYDETTVRPSTKSLHEANTMAERDGGSTFLLPHTHLYRPDKISDISGFDSL